MRCATCLLAARRLRSSRMSALAVSVIAIALSAPASADVFHDESVDGDLSNDGLAPTAFALTLGKNSLLATSVQGDREYVALTIPVGMSLSKIILVSYDGLDETAFIGVQAGAQFTEPPTGTDVANLLGWTHFGTGMGNVGLDILPDIGGGPGAIGFTPPLGEGTYTFWIQQTGTSPATYQFDFVVVPAPGAAALLGIALVRSRRRRAA